MIQLPKGSIMSWATTHDVLTPENTIWNSLSEHNRAPLTEDIERIESSHRMARGSLRKWHVADKRTWATSWDMLPHSAEFTADGKWGGLEIEAFHRVTTGAFWINVRQPDGTSVITQVVFKDFSKSVQKRGRYEFWDISVSVEEV